MRDNELVELSHTALTVQCAQPKASVVVSLINSDTTYLLPVANIELIELQATVQLSVRGEYNKFLTDNMSVLDTVTINLNKPFVDVYSISDASYLQVDKPVQDSFVCTDSTQIVCSFLRTFTDTVSFTDSGLIDFNTYVEPGYFLEDYAGLIYNF